jgi:hypothetical protein
MFMLEGIENFGFLYNFPSFANPNLLYHIIILQLLTLTPVTRDIDSDFTNSSYFFWLKLLFFIIVCHYAIFMQRS